MWGLIAQGVRCSGNPSIFSLSLEMLRCPSHPHPAPPAGGGIGITLQNKARIPPTQVRMMLFSPLAGLEMKPPALGR